MTARLARLRVRRGAGDERPRYEEFAVPFEDGTTVLDVDYACTTRLRADAVMTLDPLPGKRVLRDLVSETRPPRERLE
jgi:succinate dehydrogenase/fumarate reductase-like Fe-S protein